MSGLRRQRISGAAVNLNAQLQADAFLLVEDPNAVEGVTEIVADNTSGHVSVVGTWGAYVAPQYQWTNDHRQHHPQTGGAETFTWNRTLVTQPGRYRVYAWWQAHGWNNTVVNYYIHHAGGVTAAPVDQTRNGSRWIDLGDYDLETGTGPLVQLKDELVGNELIMMADAIRLVRLDGTLPRNEAVVDNVDPSVTIAGPWTLSSIAPGTLEPPPIVGESVHYAAAGIGDATITYPFAPSEPGRYRVHARWSEATNRATDAPYTVHHDKGVSTVRVNQQINGKRWAPLGTFDFGSGGVNKVVLSNHANGYVIADAVMFEQLPQGPVRTVAADAARFRANNAEAASVRYVHPDHLGSPQKMTDAAGAVVWSAAFSPFGRDAAITGAATNNNRFPGQYYDLETSLNYNYWRDYDPTTGRYAQSDPIGLRGGANTYGYVLGNPLNYVDDEGLIGRNKRQEKRECTVEEWRHCEDWCDPRPVDGCYVNRSFKLVRTKRGLGEWKWTETPPECNCRECPEVPEEEPAPKPEDEPNALPPFTPFVLIPIPGPGPKYGGGGTGPRPFPYPLPAM